MNGVGAVKLPDGKIVTLEKGLVWTCDDQATADDFNHLYSPISDDVQGNTLPGLPTGCYTVERAAQATSGQAIFPDWGDELR